MDSIVRRLWKFRYQAIGLGVVAAIALASVWILLAIIDGLSRVNPNVASAIVAALAGLLVLVLGQIFNRSRQLAEAHRDRKIEVYAKFVTLLFEMQQATKRGELDTLLTSEKSLMFLVDLNRDILL